MKKLLVFAFVVIALIALAIYFIGQRSNTIIVSRLVDGVPVVEISGIIDGSGGRRVVRELRRAEQTRPAAIVLSFDSFGGELGATVAVAEAIGGLSVPTVGFVKDGLAGTVFLIAAVDEIYFAPDGVCGAAAPVAIGGEDEIHEASRELVLFFELKLAEIARASGHDPELFVAFVSVESEFVRGSKSWKRTGELMTLDATEAHAIGLSLGIAESPDALIELLKRRNSDPSAHVDPSKTESR